MNWFYSFIDFYHWPFYHDHVFIIVNYLLVCWEQMSYSLSVKVCPVLKLPIHGHANTSVAIYGTYMNVSCDKGYYFPEVNPGQSAASNVGHQETTSQSAQWIIVRCKENSQWSQNVSDCKGKGTNNQLQNYYSEEKIWYPKTDKNGFWPNLNWKRNPYST